MEIKEFKSNDNLEQLESLAFAIWREHYTPIIGPDQVEYMLEKFQSKERMKEQLKAGFLYYGIYQNELIGYFAIEPRNEALFLSKFYVQSNQRGNGYGKKSFQFIIKKAKELNLNKIELTVNKYNKNSIAAYQTMGFKIMDEVVFDIGNGYVMDDFKMEYLIES